jgi:hypothetical protein
MRNGSRVLRETVVRGLAKVGLVWALAVLGALFAVMSYQGERPDGGYSLAYRDARSSLFSFVSGEEPRTAGLALALVVLAARLTVLAIGARPGRDTRLDEHEEPAAR